VGSAVPVAGRGEPGVQQRRVAELRLDAAGQDHRLGLDARLDAGPFGWGPGGDEASIETESVKAS